MVETEIVDELTLCKQTIAALENALQSSEARWRNILEESPQFGVSLNAKGEILFANRFLLEVTGWKIDDLLNKEWFNIFLPEDQADEVRNYFFSLQERKVFKEYTIYHNDILTRDGGRRSVAWFNVAEFEADGSLKLLTCLGVDQTEQKNIEAALKLSEDRLRLALEAANNAVWDLNMRTGEVYYSPQWFTMLGYEPGEMPSTYETWRDLVHKDDLGTIEAQFEDRLRRDGALQYELRMRTKDGSWKWILSRGRVFEGDASEGMRILGTHTDIHDLKIAQEALKAAKDEALQTNQALHINMAHLRTLIEAIPELVWLKDQNGVYALCNHRFERLFGAPEADIVGKTDYDFVDKDLADFFRVNDLAAVAAGKPVTNEETVHYKDDGHREELETIKTPIYDNEGTLLGVLGVARDITERNQIARELKESEIRFKALHNASFGGITIHDKGLILDCNQGLADITGYTVEELIGMDGLQLISDSTRDTVLQNILSGYEESYEVIGVRKNGEEYPLRLEARNIPYKGKSVRTVEFRDITSRKRAESELRDSELRHRVIFEKSPLGMIRFSEEGKILDCNENFVKLMGAPREKLIGFDSRNRANASMRDALIIALTGRPSSFEDYYTSVTGNKRTYLHVQFNPVNEGQSPTEVIATLEDFSERKRARDELQRAKEQAEAFSHSKTEFLANMSHEIRTPLNGILGMLQLMESTGLSEEQANYVTAAIKSSKRLTNLLSDILDLSRVEAGMLVVQETPFDLPGTIEQVCDLYKLTSEQTGVELRLNILPGIPRAVTGDPVRLQQVLTNLLGNAFKFTDSGYILLEATVLPISLPGKWRVLFSVTDTGVGIPHDKLDTLFESFTQVSQGFSRQYQGAGLGLAICKQLVDLMDGSIALESEVGGGTTLHVSIPFGEHAEPLTESSSVRSFSVPQQTSLRVLLAEDERVNSMVTKTLLSKAGYTVEVARNGLQALDALRAEDFDIVLMDIQMPVMDGVEATKEIRNGGAGDDKRAIPIIAVTAHAMVGDREKFIEAGMDSYVVKPVELDELRRVLEEVAIVKNV